MPKVETTASVNICGFITDGRFGCCVFPKDSDHRKRIFKLAGVHQRQSVQVKVAAPNSSAVVQTGLLGRFGRVFGSSNKTTAVPVDEVGTLGTGEYSYTSEKKDNSLVNLKGFHPCVPSVPVGVVPLEPTTPVPVVPNSAVDTPMPFLTAGGDLSIPFASPARYHWWNGGQRVADTLAEVLAQNQKVNHD